MPTVPVYNRQIAPQAIPTPRTPATPTFGTQALGQAIQQAGGIVQETLERANRAAVEHAMAELESGINGILYDSETGYLHKEGQHALEGLEPLEEQLTSFVSDIRGSLSGAQQQALFDQAASGTLIQSRRHVEMHHAAQTEVVAQRAYQARHENALTRLSNPVVYTDPEARTRELAAIELQATQRAEDLGLGEEATKQAAQAAKGEATIRMLNNALSNRQFEVAERIFEEGAEFLGEERDRYSRALGEIRTDRKAGRMSDKLLVDYKASPGRAEDKREILAKVFELPPGPLRDKLLQNVLAGMRLDDGIRDERIKDLYGTLMLQLGEGGWRFSAVDKGMFSELARASPTHAAKIRQYAQKARVRRSNRFIKVQVLRFQRLYDQNPARWRDMTEEELLRAFKEMDLHPAAELQIREFLRSEGDRVQEILNTYEQSPAERRARARAVEGTDVEGNDVKIAALDELYFEAASDFVQREGRKPNEPEARDIYERLTADTLKVRRDPTVDITTPLNPFAPRLESISPFDVELDPGLEVTEEGEVVGEPQVLFGQAAQERLAVGGAILATPFWLFGALGRLGIATSTEIFDQFRRAVLGHPEARSLPLREGEIPPLRLDRPLHLAGPRELTEQQIANIAEALSAGVPREEFQVPDLLSPARVTEALNASIRRERMRRESISPTDAGGS